MQGSSVQIRNPREKSARVANFEPHRSYLDPFRGNFPISIIPKNRCISKKWVMEKMGHAKMDDGENFHVCSPEGAAALQKC